MNFRKKKRNSLNIFQLSLILLTIFLGNISFSKSVNIKSEYNYGHYQNPEIDKSYNHLLGRNIYFVTEEEDNKSMYITVIYPSLTLELTLKMYTSSKKLIDEFNNGKKLYFGLDLLIDNTDSTLTNYNTDIIICIFDKESIECYDYVYQIDTEEYIRNEGGSISNNNLVPLGFQDIELNIIKSNVIDYDYYFSIKFEKSYPDLFDNITMFNWINYVASDTGDGVFGLYGIVGEKGMINIKKDEIDYIEKRLFDDGEGLADKENGEYLKINYLKIVGCIIIGIFLLL